MVIMSLFIVRICLYDLAPSGILSTMPQLPILFVAADSQFGPFSDARIESLVVDRAGWSSMMHNSNEPKQSVATDHHI